MNEASAKRCSDEGMDNQTTPSCESQENQVLSRYPHLPQELMITQRK
jgi:hypothetical protein